MDEKKFKEYLKLKYGDGWAAEWAAWKTNWQESPDYQEAVGGGAPQGGVSTTDTLLLQMMQGLFGGDTEEEAALKRRKQEFEEESWKYGQIRDIQNQAYDRWLQQLTLRENAKERAFNQQTRGLSGFLGGDEVTQGRDAKVAAAGMFDEWQKRFLSTLNKPEDWLQKWNVQNMSNPFALQPLNPIEEAQERQRLADRYKNESKRLESEWMGILQSGGLPDDSLEAQMNWDKAQAIIERKKVIDEQVPRMEMEKKLIERSPEYAEALEAATPHQDALGNWSVGIPSDEPRKPKGPAAPAWLSKFVPEYPAGSEIIAKKQVAPGSLQTLSMARPSEVAGLQGYLEWAGQVPEDWMAETMLRQTKTPNIASRWSPASQRA